MKEKQQAIEEYIRKANPELQKLEFGCEVETRDWYDNHTVRRTIKDKLWIERRKEHIKRRVFESEWVWLLSDDQMISQNDIDFTLENPNHLLSDKRTEIIGHPIHLEHVLRATDIWWRSIYTTSAMQNRKFPEYQNEGQKLYLLCSKYNLSKPFSEQADEVYEFLAEVLQVNK